MKSSSEGCNLAVVAAVIISAIETTICIFVGVRSKDPTHPFFYLQKMNFAFFTSLTLLLVVTGLNLIPMISFIINFENVPYSIVRFFFSRLMVTALMSFFHLISCICLLVLFLILDIKSADYFSLKDYKIDSNVEGFIDSVQNTLTCCGKTHGLRDWNGSVPSSCCHDRSCPKYRQNWPCFPMIKYALGSPMLIGFVTIFVSICCNLFCLWANYKEINLHFLSYYEEQKPTKAPSVHPMPAAYSRSSPCYLTESDLGNSQPYSDFKLLDADQQKHKKRASYEHDRFFSDRALLDARRGSGYRKFGTPAYVNKACDGAVKKRVCFSLPPDRSRKSSADAKHDVSEALSRNLYGVMEGCITPKYLEKMSWMDSDLKEAPKAVEISLEGGDDEAPVLKEEDKKEAGGKHGEQKKPKKHRKEAKAKENGTEPRRAMSPIQLVKGRLAKRRERREAARTNSEQGRKPDDKWH